MKLNAPKQITWIIALVLGVVGLVGYLVTIPVLSVAAFWIVLAALVLMLLATLIEGFSTAVAT